MLATGWLAPRRVVAVVQQPWGAGPLRLVVVDPLGRRVLLRRRLAGASELERAVATRRSLVLLLAPARGPRRTAVGAARLLSIDRGGRVRSVLLARLKAGSDSLRSGAGYLPRTWLPGLAVSADGARAVVVSGGAPIAEVDLRTFTVAYHEPRRTLAMLALLRNSFEPQAAAKGEVEGPQRTALWLPGGTVAVTGFGGNGQRSSTPAGLTLVNTAAGSSRRSTGGRRASRSQTASSSPSAAATPRGVTASA